MVKPTLNVNKVFIEQVEKFLKEKFHPSTTSGIINVMKSNTRDISLVMFYENRTTNPKKVLRVLSCVLYYVIDNYVYIDYLC